MEKYLIVLVGTLLLLKSAHADFDFGMTESREPHRLSIISNTIPSREAGDNGGNYGERDFSLKGSVEVSRNAEVKDGNVSATRFSVQPMIDRRVVTGLGSVGRDATLYSEGFSVGAFHLADTKEAYFFGLGVSHTGEAGPSGASLWVPNAYGAGTYHFNADTALIYGAAFTTTFGYFIPLPIFGLTSKLSRDWRLTAILPILTELKWHPLDQWNFSAFAKASGYESKISNSGSFSTPDSSVKVQSRAYMLGLGAGYEISNAFSLRGDLGALVARQLRFKDSDGTLLTEKLNAAPVMLTLSATARFGSAQ